MAVLYMDIDRTLIDTDKLKHKYLTALATFCSVPIRNLERLLTEYVGSLESSTDFDPADFAAFLALKLAGNFTPEQLTQTMLQPEHFHGVVYEDVEVLHTLGLQLGIYSEGVTSWQELKLQRTGLAQMFAADLRSIRRRKLATKVLAELQPDSIVVDDKEDVIKSLAQQRSDLHPVWINRSSNEKSTTNGVETIHSLRELPALLRKIWLGAKQTTERK